MGFASRIAVGGLVLLGATLDAAVAAADVGVVIGRSHARSQPNPSPGPSPSPARFERVNPTASRVAPAGFAAGWQPLDRASTHEPAPTLRSEHLRSAHEAAALRPAGDTAASQPARPPSTQRPLTYGTSWRPPARLPSRAHLDVRMSLEAVQPLIDEAARETGLHPALIRAVIDTASSFHPRRTSASGRVGLMQLPADVVAKAGMANPFDPRENIAVGARYLKQLVDEFDSVRLALAAYAETPDLVRKQPEGARPKEDTRFFVADVLRAYSSLVIVYLDPKP